MKKLFNLALALMVLGFLASPGWAQGRGRGGGKAKGGDASAASQDQDSDNHESSHSAKGKKHSDMPSRSNKGGAVRGRERAEEVHEMNSKSDADRDSSTSVGHEKSKKPVAGKSTTSGGSSKHSSNSKPSSKKGSSTKSSSSIKKGKKAQSK